MAAASQQQGHRSLVQLVTALARGAAEPGAEAAPAQLPHPCQQMAPTLAHLCQLIACLPLPLPLRPPQQQQLAKRALWWVLRRQHQPQVGVAAGVKAGAGVASLAGAVPCCMAAALAFSSQQN